MKREVIFRLHEDVEPMADLDLIRKATGNEKLTQEQVFLFPDFVIAKSGRNRNDTDITPTAQNAAIDKRINKPIYFQDHKTKADNQIGRIYKAWIEEEDGVTTTKGQGYGIHSDEHDPIFARIENKIHQEMSCAYDLIASHCSNCKSEIDLSTATCSNGHKMGENDTYWLDVDIVPDHISFVGRPAVEGAGLCAASAEDEVKTFSLDQQDAKDMRALAFAEFHKYMKRSHQMEDEEIGSMAERLTIKDLMRLGRIEKDTFIASLPSGKQQTRNSKDEDLGPMTYQSPKDIFQERKETR